MKALILCHDFPPLNSIGGQRPYFWFKYLNKHGICPIVITKNWVTQSANVDEVFKGNLHQTTVIKKSDEGILIKTPIVPILPEKLIIKYGIDKYKLLRKSLTFLFRTLSHIFFLFDRNKRIYYEAVKLLKKEKIDVVIATGEPWILFKYGHLLKKKFNVTWVPDYRDGWYINQELRVRNGLMQKFLSHYEYFFEKKYTSNADFVTTVDTYMANKLNKLLEKPVKLVYNGFESLMDEKDIVKSTILPLKITHTGTLKNSQDVEFLLSALSNLHNKNLIKKGELIINFLGLAYEQTQLRRVMNYNTAIRDYLYCTPRIPKNDAMQINAESDFGITFSDPKWTAIYAKTYDYVATHTPILVIPSDNGLLKKFVQEINFGADFENVSDLEDFILKAINEKKSGKGTPKFKLNKTKTLFYTRDSQTKILANYLTKLNKIKENPKSNYSVTVSHSVYGK